LPVAGIASASTWAALRPSFWRSTQTVAKRTGAGSRRRPATRSPGRWPRGRDRPAWLAGGPTLSPDERKPAARLTQHTRALDGAFSPHSWR
jgi:hypothetical protein